MATWRADTSFQAQADVDELISASLAHAKQQLAQHGEFHPFGAKIMLDGTVATFAGNALPDGAPTTLDVRALIRAAVKRKRDRLRAAAVVAMDPGGDQVIELDVDHRAGPALAVRVPYERTFFGHKVKLGDPQVTPAPAFIWD